MFGRAKNLNEGVLSMEKKRLLTLIGSVCLILVLAALPFMAACQAPPSPPAPAPPAATPPPAPPAPVPQGNLIVLGPNLGNEVWAPDVGASQDQAILAITNETLVYRSLGNQPAGGYYPRLAERWEISSDGLTWDFYLRKGIQWQGGYGEFTANDVKFSLELAGREGSVNSFASVFRPGGKTVGSYNVISPYHLQIKMNTPHALFLYYLSRYELSIVSEKYFKTVGHDVAMKNPIGTGPWKFVNYQPANYIKFEAVPNHWRQTPQFQTLTVAAVPELSAQLAMLKTGSADIAIIPAERITELESAGLHIKQMPGSGWVALDFGGQVLPSRPKYDPTCPWVSHQDEPASSDWNQRALKVRQALCLAVNKDAIVSKILYGAAMQSPILDWPLGTLWCNPDWKPYPYDPEKAKQLLTEAGYPNGFAKPITMYALNLATCPAAPKISLAVAMDWQAIGLQVNLVPIDFAAIRTNWVNRDAAWRCEVFGFSKQPEGWPSQMVSQYSKGAFCVGHESLELDKLLEACSTTLDEVERQKAAIAVGDYIYYNYIHCGIAITNTVFAMSPKISDWPVCENSSIISDLEYVTRAK
jgi:peptide/nickel transport system substrate-binding protein